MKTMADKYLEIYSKNSLCAKAKRLGLEVEFCYKTGNVTVKFIDGSYVVVTDEDCI